MNAFAQWQAARSRLNHDTLRNTWLLAIAKAASVARGEVSDELYLAEFIRELEHGWPVVAADVNALISSFDAVASPRMLFSEGPLAKCNPQNGQRLQDVIAELWRGRMDTDARRRAGENALAAANEGARALVAMWRAAGDGSGSSATLLLRQIEAFEEACRHLSRVISSFPRRLPL